MKIKTMKAPLINHVNNLILGKQHKLMNAYRSSEMNLLETFQYQEKLSSEIKLLERFLVEQDTSVLEGGLDEEVFVDLKEQQFRVHLPSGESVLNLSMSNVVDMFKQREAKTLEAGNRIANLMGDILGSINGLAEEMNLDFSDMIAGSIGDKEIDLFADWLLEGKPTVLGTFFSAQPNNQGGYKDSIIHSLLAEHYCVDATDKPIQFIREKLVNALKHKYGTKPEAQEEQLSVQDMETLLVTMGIDPAGEDEEKMRELLKDVKALAHVSNFKIITPKEVKAGDSDPYSLTGAAKSSEPTSPELKYQIPMPSATRHEIRIQPGLGKTRNFHEEVKQIFREALQNVGRGDTQAIDFYALCNRHNLELGDFSKEIAELVSGGMDMVKGSGVETITLEGIFDGHNPWPEVLEGIQKHFEHRSKPVSRTEISLFLLRNFDISPNLAKHYSTALLSHPHFSRESEHCWKLIITKSFPGIEARDSWDAISKARSYAEVTGSRNPGIVYNSHATGDAKANEIIDVLKQSGAEFIEQYDYPLLGENEFVLINVPTKKADGTDFNIMESLSDDMVLSATFSVLYA